MQIVKDMKTEPTEEMREKIERLFELGIGNPWTIEGSTGREVIGWRPIE